MLRCTVTHKKRNLIYTLLESSAQIVLLLNQTPRYQT